jgi:hypothetical protein
MSEPDPVWARVNELVGRWMLEPTQAPYFVNTPTAIAEMQAELIEVGLSPVEARQAVAQVVEHNIRRLQAHVKETRHLLDEHAQSLNDLVARIRYDVRAKLAAEHAGYKPPAVPQPKKRGRKLKQGKLL